MQFLFGKFRYFLNGAISLPALQDGGMCAQRSNLFTANTFSALDLGHITPLQLASVHLYPVESVDRDTLLNAGYMNTYGQNQNNILSPLGLQASMSGHITPEQLQGLGLYPLQTEGLTLDQLSQANYVTKDCVPTAAGLSALHMRYLSVNNLAEVGCQFGDSSQVNRQQLLEAGHVYGSYNILTPVALAAIYTGVYSRDFYQRNNAYPFNSNDQVQRVENIDQDQQQTNNNNNNNNILVDLVHVGYLHANNYYLTAIAYQALKAEYFTVEHLRNLNVWPCPSKPSMHKFVSAGYATYSGHLTVLGYSLVKAQYIPYEWLSMLGIHTHATYHIFHSALHYSGYIQSHYGEMHRRSYPDDYVSSEANEVVNISSYFLYITKKKMMSYLFI